VRAELREQRKASAAMFRGQFGAPPPPRAPASGTAATSGSAAAATAGPAALLFAWLWALLARLAAGWRRATRPRAAV